MSREERDAEAARRIVRSIAPQVQAAMQAWQRQQTAAMAKTIAEVVTPQYQRWLKDVSRIAVPALELDYASLFPNFGALQAEARKSALPGLKLIQDAQRQQFAKVIAAARRALEAALPPNWRRGHLDSQRSRGAPT